MNYNAPLHENYKKIVKIVMLPNKQKKELKMYMKNLNSYLGISFFIIFLLIFNIYTRKPVCNRVHGEYIHKNKDVILNEEMAVKIVELYLYREDAGILELHRDFDYDVKVSFDDQKYEWIVHFTAILPNHKILLDGSRTIWIRKDTGIITDFHR